MVEASGDKVVVTCPVRPHLHQPYGILHGGVYCSIVETAASVAGAMWLGDEGYVVGVVNTTNFIRATRGHADRDRDTLAARAHPAAVAGRDHRRPGPTRRARPGQVGQRARRRPSRPLAPAPNRPSG